MKKIMGSVAGIFVASTLIASGGSALAASSGPSTFTTLLNLLLGNDPTTPVAAGQPNQSCQNFPATATPGNASSAPGSAFNTSGTAGTVYAGTQTVNQKNPVSVSQYDVACSKQPTK